MKDLPQSLQHDSFKRRASRRVCDGTPSEKRGGAPSGLKRLSYDEPCLTITSAAPSEFVHPTQNRTLTIRECARIQTFPDAFCKAGLLAAALVTSNFANDGHSSLGVFSSHLTICFAICSANTGGIAFPI